MDEDPALGLQGPPKVNSGRIPPQEGEETKVWKAESAPTMEREAAARAEKQGHTDKQGHRGGAGWRTWDARAYEASTGDHSLPGAQDSGFPPVGSLLGAPPRDPCRKTGFLARTEWRKGGA